MDEPTFVLAVKMSLVIDGWFTADNPMTRDSIRGLVRRRLQNGIDGLIDSVQIIEVRDGEDSNVADGTVLGEWRDASPSGAR